MLELTEEERTFLIRLVGNHVYGGAALDRLFEKLLGGRDVEAFLPLQNSESGIYPGRNMLKASL